MPKQKFEVGNQVYILGADGKTRRETMYEVTRLGMGHDCYIRQDGKAPNGKQYREQRWDTSLLRHAVTDEMLAAFSWGNLKAGRKTTK